MLVKDFELLKRGSAYGEVPPKPSMPADETKGLVTVFTGNGKGKSSAAFMMAMRAINARMKVGVVQFCGGSPKSAEYQMLGNNPLCEFLICGAECSWRSEDRISDGAIVAYAWTQAQRMINDPAFGMVILDEIHPLLKHQYLSIDSLMRVLRIKPKALHVVMTGRHAPFELVDFADIATEMREVRHPYAKLALPSQAGIEY